VDNLLVDHALLTAFEKQHNELLKERQQKVAKHYDTNFVVENIDNTNYFDQREVQLANNAYIADQRMVQAKIKRDELQGYKQQKTKFNLIKWHLYRQKVDHIED